MINLRDEIQTLNTGQTEEKKKKDDIRRKANKICTILVSNLVFL
jgi:hypothetical protein